MKYLTFKKRRSVFGGLIIVKLDLGLFLIPHVKTPIELLPQGVKEMIVGQFDQFC